MKKIKAKIIKVIITFVCLLSLFFTSYYGLWWDCGIGRVVYTIISLRNIKSYDLEDSQPEFDVCEISSFHPNIILIIGESFDKNHSSLYGYGKDTNPLLTAKKEDSTLVVFSSVQAPGPNTHMALRQMLSLADSYEDNEWYRNPLLPTALSKSGFRTHWISNQTPVNLSNNILGSFGQLCDQYICVSKVDFYENHYDEVLFMPFKKYIAKNSKYERNFCVIHLSGSHVRYDSRYPDSYAKYVATDYEEQLAHRRVTFASYDNSILYNDYIVDSLMNIADEIEAVVIYTSDHGQDFYYTRDIAAHGRVEDAASFEAGCQIPFMIYFTKLFRDRYPEIVEHTFSLSNKEFNTKYLMNTIMDMAGYDICDYNVFENSLYEGKFRNIPNKVDASNNERIR